MVKSMTGYGRAREMLNRRDITVEVRSVNNRYLDCTVKMPRMYAFAEDAVKQRVQKAISRGKVDVFFTIDATAADVAKVTVNRDLAAGYAAALRELGEVCGLDSFQVTPEQLARLPKRMRIWRQWRRICAPCWMRPWRPIRPCVGPRGRSWLRTSVAG